MAELNIKQSQIGDVTILDLDGKITLVQGTILFRLAIRRLIEGGQKNIVLDLARVGYIDSSGIREMADSYSDIYSANGRVRVCNPTQKLQDLLSITKLLTVFGVRESVEEAVRELAAEHPFVSCPVYGCNSLIPYSDAEFRYSCTCMNCGSWLRTSPVDSVNRVWIRSIRMSTYENEYIFIYSYERSVEISVRGRLDLFASEVLEKAWLTVPLPRRVIFRIDFSNEITLAGIQKLLTLCASKEEDNVGVILPLPVEKVTSFPVDSPVYANEKNAIEALGDINSNTGWVLNFTTAQR